METATVQALTPFVSCVFEALFGEDRHEPLQGTGELLDGGVSFRATLARQRGVLKVILPHERDLTEGLALVFPFDAAVPIVQKWPELPSFTGSIGHLTVMGQIVAVNEMFALMVVHEMSRGSADLALKDPVCLVIPTRLTDGLKAISVES